MRSTLVQRWTMFGVAGKLRSRIRADALFVALIWLRPRMGAKLLNMRTVTIRELHLNTLNLVRAAARQKIIITDRGRPIALLKTLDEPDLVGKLFPRRDIRKMPKSKVDSTIYVAQGRDRR